MDKIKQYNIYVEIPSILTEKFTINAKSEKEALKLFKQGQAVFIRSWHENDPKNAKYEVTEFEGFNNNKWIK